MGIWGLYGPEQTPENYLRQVADQFNCTTTDTNEMVECLRLIEAVTLYRARFECTVSYLCNQNFLNILKEVLFYIYKKMATTITT